MSMDQMKEIERLAEEHRQARSRRAWAVAGVLGIFVLLLLNHDSERLPYIFLGSILLYGLVVLAIFLMLNTRRRRHHTSRHKTRHTPGR